ncbi:MAG: LysE family transporter [Bacteroidota bacterium]|nr:LysE family transporter [Bacteroidota bacterium]
MLDTILIGLATGFVLAWGFGTVFFSLIQTGVEHGYRKAMNIAFGVLVSDGIMILIAVGGSSILTDVIKKYQPVLGFVGGFALILLGFGSFFKKQKTIKAPQSRVGNFLFFFSTGVFMNIINPVNFLAWLGVASIIYPFVNHTGFENFIFYLVVLLTIFTTESTIAYFSNKVKQFFTPAVFKFVNRVTGMVYAGIGIYLIYDNCDEVMAIMNI